MELLMLLRCFGINTTSVGVSIGDVSIGIGIGNGGIVMGRTVLHIGLNTSILPLVSCRWFYGRWWNISKRNSWRFNERSEVD